MGTLWRIAPCRCPWWRLRCRECGGRRRVAVPLTYVELEALAERTICGEVYRSRAAAEAMIERR
jgi:hypothetical protein